MDASKRFRAEAVSLGEWKQWLEEQVRASAAGAKTSDGEDIERLSLDFLEKELVYIALRLDGKLSTSGKGIPPYGKLIEDTAPMDSFMSRVEKA
eukprot:scaffold1006_cov408-Prasinococcus_capsulatus_cf.AAC.21